MAVLPVCCSMSEMGTFFLSSSSQQPDGQCPMASARWPSNPMARARWPVPDGLCVSGRASRWPVPVWPSNPEASACLAEHPDGLCLSGRATRWRVPDGLCLCGRATRWPVHVWSSNRMACACLAEHPDGLCLYGRATRWPVAACRATFVFEPKRIRTSKSTTYGID